ncbi:hypothetical protein N0V82_001862 [Gnomoniopsis sp. IMI 355080]|nr:hypothetical protein N0V82_001862 [Gnomoniopsis sp. IMI 355080]
MSLRALAASLPVKSPLRVPLTPRSRALLAAVALVLVWIIGPRTGFRQNTDTGDPDDTLFPQSSVSIIEEVKTGPFVSAHQKDRDLARIPTASDQVLSYSDAEKLCFRFHLEPHNNSAPVGLGKHAQHVTTPRRIYDLLLITPTTTADMLELHLASMYPYVEYFIMLEAPSIEKKASADPSRESLSGAPRIEAPSLLDKIWKDRLSAYHARIIRHSLSQHSHDFKDGLDHEMTTRNAFYTRVIPLLTGKQRVEPGDVLLISDVEELVRPVTMKILRNCAIPERTTIRTRKYWYSYQYMKISSRAGQELQVGNEWWPHPQATVYTGADTILPADLRKHRGQDQYTFADGGWTCYLCDRTITETLAKLNKSGVIWADGPRWKAAGRVVDRVMNGVDLLERSNLSRIESNPDLPPYLKANADRFKWMLDRDGPGANFIDFDAQDVDRYLGKKKTVEAEPDFERTKPNVLYNLENTQQAVAPPPQAVDWRTAEATDASETSDENRKDLTELEE